MKKLPSTVIARALFLMTLAVLLVLDLVFLHARDPLMNLASDILCCSGILLFSPIASEKGKGSRCPLILAVSLIVAEVVSMLLKPQFRVRVIPLKLVIPLAAVLPYSIARCRKKYSSLRSLFKNSAVWHDLESYSRLFFIFMHSWLTAVFLVAIFFPSSLPSAVVALVLSLLWAAVLYEKVRTGHTILVRPEMEKRIKEVISGNLRSSPVMQEEESPVMNGLYRRIIQYMDQKQPFLNPDFTLKEMSAKMLSNKTYISRTINFFSGRNFRQFVNYYRVNYAASAFRDDPTLRVTEVALMSGFHSIASFNMAFKTILQLTPGDYLKKVRDGEELPRRE